MDTQEVIHLKGISAAIGHIKTRFTIINSSAERLTIKDENL